MVVAYWEQDWRCLKGDTPRNRVKPLEALVLASQRIWDQMIPALRILWPAAYFRYKPALDEGRETGTGGPR